MARVCSSAARPSGQGRDGPVAVVGLIAQRDVHGIPAALACRTLGVSRSWFYKHDDGGLPPQAARREQLKAEVRQLFAAHRGTYGSPRITAGPRG